MLYSAQGISFDDAIWNTDEHVGWQMIHSFEHFQGNQRKFTNPWTQQQSIKGIENFRSDDNITKDETEESDENLRI